MKKNLNPVLSYTIISLAIATGICVIVIFANQGLLPSLVQKIQKDLLAAVGADQTPSYTVGEAIEVTAPQGVQLYYYVNPTTNAVVYLYGQPLLSTSATSTAITYDSKGDIILPKSVTTGSNTASFGEIGKISTLPQQHNGQTWAFVSFPSASASSALTKVQGWALVSSIEPVPSPAASSTPSNPPGSTSSTTISFSSIGVANGTATIPTIAAGCAVPASPKQSFYVDPTNGSDTSGDGSQANPWKTLSAVLTTKLVTNKNASGPVQPGDAIYLESGDYGSVSIQGYNQGQRMKNIPYTKDIAITCSFYVPETSRPSRVFKRAS